MAQLEEDLSKAQKLIDQSLKDAEEVDCLKSESEKTLTKAKSIIFERTKVIKNQELQIEAYNQQIESLKDVVRITKDLLEIRNLEIKQLEGKIDCMENRMKGEKERQDLLHKKLETMIRHNGELKREYETQLCLFSALRERYNERELARGVVEEARGVVEDARRLNSAANAPNVAANSPNVAASTPNVATNAPANLAEQAKANLPVVNGTEEPGTSKDAPEEPKTE